MVVHTTSTKPPSAERVTPDEISHSLSRVLRPRDRVVVLGGYGCGNLGDEAILTVLLDDLRQLGARTHVVSANPAETARLHNVGVVQASAGSVARAILAADAVLIGGGGIFSSYMGDRSRRLPELAAGARLLRKKVIFRALGVYRETPGRVARSLVRAMEHADFISVRDEASIEALRGFGLRSRLYLEDDPAMRLAPAQFQDARSGRVGLAVRQVRNAADQASLRACIIEVANRLIASGRSPYFLPFSAHPSEPCEQDDAYCRELIASTLSPTACCVVPPSTSPAQMLGLFSHLDAVIAMRFHAIVFAAASGVPMVALPYDDKCSSFLAEHGLAGLDIKTVSAAAIIAALAGVERRVAG